jgi:hypothetical protein
MRDIHSVVPSRGSVGDNGRGPDPHALSGPVGGPDTGWVKATASNQGGECVELRRRADAVEIRDSKNPRGPVLRFGPSGLATWLAAARSTGLDRLARD